MDHASGRRYSLMEQQATRLGLLESPYPTHRDRDAAWESGYRDALRDIARGKVTVPGVTR